MDTQPLFDSPPSANEAIAKLRLRERDISLLELETKGILSWDRDEHIVKKGINFDEKWDEMC